MLSPFRARILVLALTACVAVALPARLVAQRRGGGMRFGRAAQRAMPHQDRGFGRFRPPRAARPPLGAGLQRLFQLPPGQRESALRGDPAFQRLPPARQRQLLNGLRRLNAMPPAQQRRVIRRMQDLGRLTPPQRAGLMRVFRQFQAMPPAQRRAFRMAYNNLRQLPPTQRALRMNQPGFQRRFSAQQIQALRQALHLNLPSDVVGARPNGGGF